MKKTMFLGFAALLALAVISCGDPAVSDEEGVINLLGPELVTGRALVGSTSEAGTNYYEATFQRGTTSGGTFTPDSPTRIIRAKWGYARKGRIQLEPADYKVILMAGRSADTTLLGVGKATQITNKDAITEVETTTATATATLVVTIEPTTTDLFFTVYALINDINAKADSTSTFATTLSPITSAKPTTKDELGNKVPVFMLDKGNADTAVTWKFGMGDYPGATNDLIALLGLEIIVSAAPSLHETGFSYTDTYDVPQKLTAKSITAPTPSANISSGTVTISATAPNDDGMVQVALEIPVVAIATTDEPTKWNIRGGLNNGAIDAGITPTYAKPGSIGGAVVLGFGNLSNFPVITLHPTPGAITP